MRQIHRGIGTPQAEGVVAWISGWRLYHGTELLVDPAMVGMWMR
jgi:hypothetical protein